MRYTIHCEFARHYATGTVEELVEHFRSCQAQFMSVLPNPLTELCGEATDEQIRWSVEESVKQVM